MFNFSSLRGKSIAPVILAFVMLVVMAAEAKTVQASILSNDLQALVTEGNSVNAQLSSIILTADNSCAELGNAVASVNSFTNSIELISLNITSPLSVDTDSLNALDQLTLISANASALLPGLSTSIATISLTEDMADFRAAMDAMLKLSDDIGVMANRILEMADKILVMSDNIGDMADRILLTQQIQSTNLALTQATMLTTQQNIVALASTVDTSLYNNTLSSLKSTGATLVADMTGLQLTETNMSSELADFESRVSSYMNSIVLLAALINADSSIASHYINSDTLTMMGDLSVVNAALATSLNAYADAVNMLAPNTNITVLNDAIYSMLRLTSGIGEMGSRIVEMGDDINIMADNIGVMAMRIVETQTLQQANLELTQSNLTAAQITSIQIIAAFGL